ncbi:MAG: CopG family transcriptional regulator [Roseiflexaceae bacterium]
MVRTQIQLTERQTQRLKALAKERGVSMAELVRQSVDTMLESPETTDREERKRRALSIIGMFRSDMPDLSINHDQYLAEAYET